MILLYYQIDGAGPIIIPFLLVEETTAERGYESCLSHTRNPRLKLIPLAGYFLHIFRDQLCY